MLNNIINITEEKELLVVEYKNKKGVFLIFKDLNEIENILKKVDEFKLFDPTLVLLNTKNNFDALIKHWNKISQHNKKLCLIFSNPNLDSDNKWMLFPHTHSMISDTQNLREGLQAIANNIELVDNNDIEKYF